MIIIFLYNYLNTLFNLFDNYFQFNIEVNMDKLFRKWEGVILTFMVLIYYQYNNNINLNKIHMLS